MDKVVIVNSGYEDVILNYGVAAVSTVSACENQAIKILRSILVRINPKFISFFYNKKWLTDLLDYDTIIVFDCMNLSSVCKKISAKYPNRRKIVFFWNPILKKITPSILVGWEIWTSDYFDSVRFHFKYGGQFVFDKLFSEIDDSESCCYDAYFVGINKGRFGKLRKLQYCMEHKLSLNVRFILVSPFLALFDKNYSSGVSYKVNLQIASQSRSMIEFNQEGQRGLTLRCLESLFLQKKLLTNNTSVSLFNFFSSDNIMFLDSKKPHKIKKFIRNESFVYYSEDTLSQYRFMNWLGRIINNIEISDIKI